MNVPGDTVSKAGFPAIEAGLKEVEELLKATGQARDAAGKEDMEVALCIQSCAEKMRCSHKGRANAARESERVRAAPVLEVAWG